MGIVGKAQLRGLLEDLCQGTIDFDGYLDSLGDEYPSLQQQLQAALAQSKVAKWTSDEYQLVRICLEEEFDLAYQAATTVSTRPTFTPWSPIVQARSLPEGWEYGEDGKAVREDGDTSHVAQSSTGVKGRTAKSVDPVRSKSGRFLPGVAELWYYAPETGLMVRAVFTTGEDPIAAAYKRAGEIQAYWTDLGVKDVVAMVKFRQGQMAGNRHIHLVSSLGYIACPQDIVRWAGQAKAAGIRQKLGEKMCQTKASNISLMLEQNKLYKGDRDLRNVDVPSVEPGENGLIPYSIRFQSGDTRVVTCLPLADVKDEETGEVTLAGHRKRAYRLLLDSSCSRCDGVSTIKYVTYGKEETDVPTIHVITRDEAIRWAEAAEKEDEILAAIEAECQDDDGLVLPERADEYICRKGARLAIIDPPDPVRGRQVTTSGHVSLNYNGDGTLNWQKAKNSGGPGTNWVAGMRHHEAQVYNM